MVQATSFVHTLGTDGRRSVVAVVIRTGRTHQIRVHLQHLRFPLLGDPTYGDSNWNRIEAKRATRPMLHAWQIRLKHPMADEGTGAGEGPPRQLCVTAPPPDDLAALIAGIVECEPAEAGAWVEEAVGRELAYSLDGFQF